MSQATTSKPANRANWFEQPRADLPPGMGFANAILDVAGNRVGLHAQDDHFRDQAGKTLADFLRQVRL